METRHQLTPGGSLLAPLRLEWFCDRWQMNRESRSFVGAAADFDMPAVRRNNTRDDAKARLRTLLTARWRLHRPVKALEDVGDVFRGNTVSCIFDSDYGFRIAGVESDDDTPLQWGVFNRISTAARPAPARFWRKDTQQWLKSGA